MSRFTKISNRAKDIFGDDMLPVLFFILFAGASFWEWKRDKMGVEVEVCRLRWSVLVMALSLLLLGMRLIASDYQILKLQVTLAHLENGEISKQEGKQ